jgi:tRNA-dihydrouridine synthase B
VDPHDPDRRVPERYPRAVRSLTDSWRLGGVEIANRLVLAPLAGIGNWFVRLQARRHGAGLVISEMVSSFGVKHGNERTIRELLRIHPEEHPVSIQLFGQDPEVMREAAAVAAEAGADLIDINMGCPVRKVCKTGAGAALLDDHDRAVAIARAAAEGGGLPVTVKLRPGQRPGERNGLTLARRLAGEAHVSGIAFHPRHASQQHKGAPDYDLAAELVEALELPVMLSGGLSTDQRVLEAFERSGADAVMLARGSLGNPWRFERLLGLREGEPSADEVLEELDWVIERCDEHLGPGRSGRYLRKVYPWYAERLGLSKAVQQRLGTAPSTAAAREVLHENRHGERPRLAA